MRSYDESHWYSHSGWPQLRGQVIKLARSILPVLQDGLRNPDRTPDEAAEAFVAEVVTAIGDIVDRQISEQLRTSADEEGMSLTSSLWAYALRLFAESDDLTAMLAKDAHLILGQTNRNVSPEEAVGRTLKTFLENARREISSDSANRLKNWEAIDRVSLEVASVGLGTPLERRCSDEHVEAVFALLKGRYPESKNLPIRRISTLYEYFDEFCVACAERHEAEYGAELLALRDETNAWPTIDLCLDRLRADRIELWEALAVRVGLDEIGGVTQQQYLASNGLSRHGFEVRFREAQALMLACVENSVAFQLQRSRVA